MAYVWLAPVLAMCCVGAWTSYDEDVKAWKGYVPSMAILGAACAACFGLAVRKMAKTETYAFSLYYDAVVFSCYYLLPVMLWEAKLTPPLVAGTVLVLLGVAIVKMG